MPKLLAALLIAASLASGTTTRLMGADFTPDKNWPNNDQAKDLLAEGVKEYRAGRYQAAAAAFHSALKLEPDNYLLFQFTEATGDGLLVKMEEYDELDDVLKEILRRGRIYQREMRHSPEYIKLLMDKLGASEEERVVATLELIAVGPVAIPWLLDRMNDNRQDEMRTYCRVALTRMGYRAVIALDEALKSKDQRTVESAAMVLADIADPRSLPMLEALAQNKDASDTAKRVAANAVGAIIKAAQIQGSPSADGQYFTEALRYFRDGDRVQDEMVANESLMWKWDDSQDVAKKLSFVRVPRYAWNELMAEQLLYDGIALNPKFNAYYPLLAADFAAEAVDPATRLRLAKEATVPVQFPDEDVAALQARVDALTEQSNRIKLFGGPNLYHAVQTAIVAERYDVSTYLMRVLEDRYLARADVNLPSREEGLTPDKVGSVLCAALDHPEKEVRIEAAITLAHLDPALSFFNAEKVVPVLAQAVGEWGLRVVLVVDQDYHQRNSAKEQLQKAGYMVSMAMDGFEAVQRLEETPVKDVILISGLLLSTVKDEKGNVIDVPEQQAATLIQEFRKDPRSEKTPLFISLPDDPGIATKLQAAFQGKVDGFIQEPYNAADMRGKIDLVLKDAQLPNLNRENAEDVSLRAAQALQVPNPARTQFDLSQAAEALVGTLDKRADALRIEANKALGIAAQGSHGDAVRAMISKVDDVYGAQDNDLKPAVRASFLYSIGQLNPATDASVAILLKALQFQDADAQATQMVRAAASEAVGHGILSPDELLSKYLNQQRPDVRGPGAGKDPLDDITSGSAKPAGAADAPAPAADAPAPAAPADAPAPAPAPAAPADK